MTAGRHDGPARRHRRRATTMARPHSPDARPAPVVAPAAPAGEFVGREPELAQLAALVAAHRLVAVTGPPGVGKTRLARHLAAEVSQPRRVYVVDVGAAPVPVAGAVASAVGIRTDHADAAGLANADAVAGIAGLLGDGSHLLVLDNCDAALVDAAELVVELLHRCGRLRVVVTSREALGAVGEAVFVVAPLPVPPDADPVADPDAVRGSPSVQLFCERAAAARRGFTVSDADLGAVAELCRRLDGLPLALELAAARLRVMSLPEVVAGLDDRFTLLAAPGRAGRRRSLRAALDASYDLLTASERLLLARLSVFPGGCTLEAAEQVCEGGEIHTDDVLDLVDALVAKSLVVAHTDTHPARYTLLESVRVYAFGRLLATSESAQVQARQARWSVGVVDRGPQHHDDPEAPGWLAELEVEADNLAAALGWAVAEGRLRTAMALAGRVVPVWWRQGRYRQAQGWLEQALRLRGRAPVPVRVKLLCDAAMGAVLLGELERAQAWGDEALAAATEADDTRGRIEALRLLGFVASAAGDTVRGLALLDEAVEAAGADDAGGLTNALAARGRAHLLTGDAAQGRADFAASMEVARGVDPTAAVNARIGVGWASLCLGDYDDAATELEQALAGARRLRDTHAIALALVWKGELARLRGEAAEARSLLHECRALARRLGTPHPLARALLSLGRLAAADGHLEAAADLFDEALALARSASLPFMVAPGLVALGGAALAQDDRERARPLLRDALTLAEARHDRASQALALAALGDLARADGDDDRGRRLHHESLSLRAEIGDRAGIADSLEALAGLSVADGLLFPAGRLFGAAEALREKGGYQRAFWRRARYEADVASLTRGAAAEKIEAARQAGRKLRIEQAVRLASKGRGRRDRPATGWDALTPTEREVVELVTEGLTNAEVGARLFVSRETVKAHLSRVFAKLGVRSRRELRTLGRYDG